MLDLFINGPIRKTEASWIIQASRLRSPRINDITWIISGPRLVPIQDASIEDVVNYFEIGAVKYWC